MGSLAYASDAETQRRLRPSRPRSNGLAKLVSKFEILDALSTVESPTLSRPPPSPVSTSATLHDSPLGLQTRHWPSMTTDGHHRSIDTPTTPRNRGTSVTERRKLFEKGGTQSDHALRTPSKIIVEDRPEGTKAATDIESTHEEPQIVLQPPPKSPSRLERIAKSGITVLATRSDRTCSSITAESCHKDSTVKSQSKSLHPQELPRSTAPSSVISSKAQAILELNEVKKLVPAQADEHPPAQHDRLHQDVNGCSSVVRDYVASTATGNASTQGRSRPNDTLSFGPGKALNRKYDSSRPRLHASHSPHAEVARSSKQCVVGEESPNRSVDTQRRPPKLSSTEAVRPKKLAIRGSAQKQRHTPNVHVETSGLQSSTSASDVHIYRVERGAEPRLAF